jgi:hypothetical protein
MSELRLEEIRELLTARIGDPLCSALSAPVMR